MVLAQECEEMAMKYDFSEVEDVDVFVSIPEGEYLCRVAEVREGTARDESLRWSLRLEVVGGELSGRTAGWDSMTWSSRGVHRVKHVLGALGFEMEGTVDVDSEELLGRQAHVTFREEEWENPETGRRQVRLCVPFIGYRSEEEAAESTA
jgi:hypothetical protein